MKIEYNFVSRGTERESGSDGYMAVTQKIGKKRYLLPIPHKQDEIDELTKDYLVIKHVVTTPQLAVARFRLIPALFLERNKVERNSKILVVGCGCIGYALLEELYYRGYKQVTYTTVSSSASLRYPRISSLQVDYKDYDVIFDTSGKSEVLDNIILNCKPQTTIVLLGTPRGEPKANLLQVHRKNLNICGAHELFGYSAAQRQKVFDKVLKNIQQQNPCYLSVCNYIKIDQVSPQAKFSAIYNIVKR